MPPPERTGAARAHAGYSRGSSGPVASPESRRGLSARPPARSTVSQILIDVDEDEWDFKDENELKREPEQIEQVVFGDASKPRVLSASDEGHAEQVTLLENRHCAVVVLKEEPVHTAKSYKIEESVASAFADTPTEAYTSRMSRPGPQKADGPAPNSFVVEKRGRAPSSNEPSASATKRPRVNEEHHGTEVIGATSQAAASDKKKHRARYSVEAVHPNGYYCVRCARAVIADRPVVGLSDAALLICGLEKCSVALKCLYCRHASKGCESPVDEAMTTSKSAYAAQVKYEHAVRTDQGADIIAAYKDDLHAKVQSFLNLQRQYARAKPARQSVARGTVLSPPSRASETTVPNLQRKETGSVAPASEADRSASIVAQAASALTPAQQERFLRALESIAHNLSVIADISRAAC